jgi:hypothetical protein
MKKILLCAAAFSLVLSMIDLKQSLHAEVITIDHEAFRQMNCEPLFDADGNEIHAPDDCIFGGYYPRPNPLDYQIKTVTPSHH